MLVSEPLARAAGKHIAMCFRYFLCEIRKLSKEQRIKLYKKTYAQALCQTEAAVVAFIDQFLDQYINRKSTQIVLQDEPTIPIRHK